MGNYYFQPSHTGVDFICLFIIKRAHASINMVETQCDRREHIYTVGT